MNAADKALREAADDQAFVFLLKTCRALGPVSARDRQVMTASYVCGWHDALTAAEHNEGGDDEPV